MRFLFLPEFFLLLGIDLFLGISLLTCLLDKHLPSAVPYLYQIGALVGFAQLLIMKDSMTLFGDYVRFSSSLAYLVMVIANVVSINVYIAFMKRMWSIAKILFASVTFPTILIATFFVSGYAALLEALPPLPLVPLGVLFLILVTCSVVMGIGVYTSFRLQVVKPKLKNGGELDECKKNIEE